MLESSFELSAGSFDLRNSCEVSPIILKPATALHIPDVPEPTAAQEQPPKRKRGAGNNARAGTHAHA
jgi:hypothetical protein